MQYRYYENSWYAHVDIGIVNSMLELKIKVSFITVNHYIIFLMLNYIVKMMLQYFLLFITNNFFYQLFSIL